MSYELIRAVALSLAICFGSGAAAGSTKTAGGTKPAGSAKPAALPPEKTPTWLSDVAVQPLPVQLTAKQTKTSKYLIEPIKDEVYLTISHQAIRWRSKLDPAGFVLTPKGIRAPGSAKPSAAAGASPSAAAGASPKAPAPRWLGGLFTALQAVAAGDFAGLAKDFRLHSPAKGKLIATPKAKELAAVVSSLTLSFSAADKPTSAQNLRLNQVTIASPHEQTMLSDLRFVTDRP